MVNLLRSSLDEFSIQLTDGQAPLYGSGIGDESVSVNSVRVLNDARVGIDGRVVDPAAVQGCLAVAQLDREFVQRSAEQIHQGRAGIQVVAPLSSG